VRRKKPALGRLFSGPPCLSRASEIKAIACLSQIHRHHTTATLRQAPNQFPARAHHAGRCVDRLRDHLVADRVRHELHGDAQPLAARLHLLQLLLPHLLLDGLLLHPVRSDAGALLANVQNDSREGATFDAAPPPAAQRAQHRQFGEGRTVFERSRKTGGACFRVEPKFHLARHVTSRHGTTRHNRRVERVEPRCSTNSTQPKCTGSTRRTCRVAT